MPPTKKEYLALAEEERSRLNARLENLVEERTASLARSEHQLRLVWESALDGMRLTDADGTVVRVNDAYCRLVRQPRAALEVQPMCAPYPDTRHAEILEKHRRHFHTRDVPARLETGVTLRDGSRLDLELANAFVRSQTNARGSPPTARSASAP